MVGRLNQSPLTKPPLRPLGPSPQPSASITTTRRLGLELLQVPGGPQPGVAAADDDDVGAALPSQRRRGARPARPRRASSRGRRGARAIAPSLRRRRRQALGDGDSTVALDAARSVALDQLSLDDARLAVRAARRVHSRRRRAPSVGVVGERAVEDVERARRGPCLEDRGHQLDPVVEVARHQVGGADVDARRLAVALERVDPRVLEEAADDRDDLDVLRDARDPGAQRADPAHVELHLTPACEAR